MTCLDVYCIREWGGGSSSTDLQTSPLWLPPPSWDFYSSVFLHCGSPELCPLTPQAKDTTAFSLSCSLLHGPRGVSRGKKLLNADPTPCDLCLSMISIFSVPACLANLLVPSVFFFLFWLCCLEFSGVIHRKAGSTPAIPWFSEVEVLHFYKRSPSQPLLGWLQTSFAACYRPWGRVKLDSKF